MAHRAIAAAAANFHRHRSNVEIVLAGPRLQTFHGGRAVEFFHGSAGIADREDCLTAVVGMVARDKGVQAFKAVRQAVVDQAL